MTSRRRLRVTLGPIGLAVVALAACSSEAEPSSHAPDAVPDDYVTSAADCDQLLELADSGRPVDEVEGAVEPAQAIEIPRVDGADDPVATVVARDDQVRREPRENPVVGPDPDVDTVVAVARTDIRLEDLRRDGMEELQNRITEKATAQGLELAGYGLRGGGPEGEFEQIFRGYSDPDGELSATSYICTGTTWLAFRMSVVPPTPESAATPLPGCAELTARFPDGIYAEPTYFADPSISDEVDDAEGARRQCRIGQAGTASVDTRTLVYLERRPPEPEWWRDRFEALHEGTESFVAQTCSVQDEPEPLPGGPADSLLCTSVNGLEAEAAVAAVVDNDYWVGVRHTARQDDSSAQNAEEAAATASQVLAAMQP